MRKEIENPRYATNSDQRIEYDEVYYDDAGNWVSQEVVSVDEGTEAFSSMLDRFGEEQLMKNKQSAMEEAASKNIQVRTSTWNGPKTSDEKKKEKQMEVFQLKSFLFETRLLRETENKELRRNIRKAQTSEEALLTAMMLLMEEFSDIKVDPEKLASLLTKKEDLED